MKPGLPLTSAALAGSVRDPDPSLILPPAIARFILGAVFAPPLQEWEIPSPALDIETRNALTLSFAHEEELLDDVEPVVQLTALSPNKLVFVAVFLNQAILLQHTASFYYPPIGARGEVMLLSNQKMLKRVSMMRPKAAASYLGPFSTFAFQDSQRVVAVAVSDFADIGLIRACGDVYLADSKTVVPGKPCFYQSFRIFGEVSSQAVAYACCFPPDSDDEYTYDSTLIAVRAVAGTSDILVERCVLRCEITNIDTLMPKDGPLRTWQPRMLRPLCIPLQHPREQTSSIFASLSPFGHMLVLVYDGQLLHIPILFDFDANLETYTNLAHIDFPKAEEDDPASSRIPTLDLSKGISPPTKITMTVITCRCGCPLEGGSVERASRFESQISGNPIVFCQNLNSMLLSYLPHARLAVSSPNIRLSWTKDGALYALEYSGVLIFVSAANTFCTVSLLSHGRDDLEADAMGQRNPWSFLATNFVTTGPILSIGQCADPLITSFAFIDGRYLVLRLGRSIKILHLALAYNQLGIQEPERWSFQTHSIAMIHLARRLPIPIPSFLGHDTQGYTTKLRQYLTLLAYATFCLSPFKLATQIITTRFSQRLQELNQCLDLEGNVSNLREPAVAAAYFEFLVLVETHVRDTIIRTLEPLIAACKLVFGDFTANSEVLLLQTLQVATYHDLYDAVFVITGALLRTYFSRPHPLAAVFGERLYRTIVESIMDNFRPTKAFFYARLQELNAVTISETSQPSSPGRYETASRTMLTSASASNHARLVAHVAIILLKLTCLFASSAQSLEEFVRWGLQDDEEPGSSRQDLYYQLVIATCGFCCLAHDWYVKLIACTGNRVDEQRQAFFAQLTRVLAWKCKLHFLDGACISLISMRVSTVPLLPFYLVNICAPYLSDSVNINIITKSPIEERFPPLAEEISRLVLQEVVQKYSFLYGSTTLQEFCFLTTPGLSSILGSILHNSSLSFMLNGSPKPLHVDPEKVPTLTNFPAFQVFRLIYNDLCELRLEQALYLCLWITHDPMYVPQDVSLTGVRPSLTEAQLEILEAFQACCEELQETNAMSIESIRFILTLRGKIKPPFFDYLVRLACNLVIHGTLTFIHPLMVYVEASCSNDSCHCKPLIDMATSTTGLNDRSYITQVLEDREIYINNLDEALSPLLSVHGAAILLTAAGRAHEGVYFLIRKGFEAHGLALLDGVLLTIPDVEEHDAIGVDSFEEAEQKAVQYAYRCLKPRLEELQRALESWSPERTKGMVTARKPSTGQMEASRPTFLTPARAGSSGVQVSTRPTPSSTRPSAASLSSRSQSHNPERHFEQPELELNDDLIPMTSDAVLTRPNEQNYVPIISALPPGIPLPPPPAPAQGNVSSFQPQYLAPKGSTVPPQAFVGQDFERITSLPPPSTSGSRGAPPPLTTHTYQPPYVSPPQYSRAVEITTQQDPTIQPVHNIYVGARPPPVSYPSTTLQHSAPALGNRGSLPQHAPGLTIVNSGPYGSYGQHPSVRIQPYLPQMAQSMPMPTPAWPSSVPQVALGPIPHPPPQVPVQLHPQIPVLAAPVSQGIPIDQPSPGQVQLGQLQMGPMGQGPVGPMVQVEGAQVQASPITPVSSVPTATIMTTVSISDSRVSSSGKPPRSARPAIRDPERLTAEQSGAIRRASDDQIIDFITGITNVHDAIRDQLNRPIAGTNLQPSPHRVHDTVMSDDSLAQKYTNHPISLQHPRGRVPSARTLTTVDIQRHLAELEQGDDDTDLLNSLDRMLEEVSQRKQRTSELLSDLRGTQAKFSRLQQWTLYGK
ncbi:hypothetical protein GMRT_15641 [Giardia muris]|uniref:Uncharacterized protein n=1 Tax=Giardia muris TaxID=5742 RepID=A0A4Z1SZ56_GIAMU|nr:hypothetical protein GMRT_15641 [Giardia muris]|eukprot:TNJ28768.1 hypothetical protein GMRT_15641 [Giardia muris]